MNILSPPHGLVNCIAQAGSYEEQLCPPGICVYVFRFVMYQCTLMGVLGLLSMHIAAIMDGVGFEVFIDLKGSGAHIYWFAFVTTRVLLQHCRRQQVKQPQLMIPRLNSLQKCLCPQFLTINVILNSVSGHAVSWASTAREARPCGNCVLAAATALPPRSGTSALMDISARSGGFMLGQLRAIRRFQWLHRVVGALLQCISNAHPFLWLNKFVTNYWMILL